MSSRTTQTYLIDLAHLEQQLALVVPRVRGAPRVGRRRRAERAQRACAVAASDPHEPELTRFAWEGSAGGGGARGGGGVQIDSWSGGAMISLQ